MVHQTQTYLKMTIWKINCEKILYNFLTVAMFLFDVWVFELNDAALSKFIGNKLFHLIYSSDVVEARPG